MHLLELILIAIGLSFDTFAVSISAGLTVSDIRFWQGVRIALIMALFQSLMPLIGWIGGIQLGKYMSEYDHWVAFALLLILGVKVILDAFKSSVEKSFNPLLFSVQISMAIATSLDALAVGISLGVIGTNIFMSLLIIGFTTFMASMVGMLLGKNATRLMGKEVDIAGGLILIGIGVKILLDHIL